jgi:outer membrane protein assembly factor BamB
MNQSILHSAIVIFVSTILPVDSVNADDWGHWRGPTGNGVAANATPPTEWSDSKNVKWKVEIPGKGSGSPIVWNDQVFVVTAVPANAPNQSGNAAPAETPPTRGRGGARRGGGALPELQFKILCFNRMTGKLEWEQTAIVATPHEQTHDTNGFASASPCTDGQHVFVSFNSRGLYCYTMDGTLKWKRNDFGKMTARNGFGEGSSPTLAGDLLILPWDHEGQSAIYAIDKSTGQTVWKTDRDEPTNWSTPLVVEHDGQQQIVMNGQNNARAYDLKTGQELWRCDGQTERPASSAVASDGLVYVTSGFRGSFLGAFRLGGNGDIKGTENVAWTLNRGTPDIASPLLTSGRLYFYKAKNGILSCVDAATGKHHFENERIPGLGTIYASPVAAGGYIFLTDRDGDTVVIKDADQLEIVASNSVGETVDATPAPVGNELFIRGEKHLFCIGE